MRAMKYQVLLFYKYVTLADPDGLAEEVRVEVAARGLAGRAIIATEGINATFEGDVAATESFAEWILSKPEFADVTIKRSEGDGNAFPKLSIKVRDEIVGTKFSKDMADPEHKTAPRITAQELKKQFEHGDDVVIIDMRNNYEFQSGHFKGSINPGLDASRDLPAKLPELEQYKNKKVVTVCTGGIRCEKMSAFLLNNGFEDVSQLDNGIHEYMEQYPGEDFLGTLYTFDTRKTMHFGGEREIIGRCYLCDGETEEYTNCVNDFCHRHFMVCAHCKQGESTACSDECAQKVSARV